MRWLHVHAIVAVFLCQAQSVLATGAPKREPTCLQGAYIQLVNENGAWDKARWRTLFDGFHKLQIRNLIVQWAVYDQLAFYRSQRFETIPAAPLETILALADDAGIRVMIGLSHDSAYWERISKNDKRSYLIERLSRNMAVAAELSPLASAHPSFAGWYISEEVDDINWRQTDDREALFSYLRQMSVFLRVKNPRAKIGVSGFANAETPPSEVQTFWLELLTRAGALDRVYFQDGVGVGKLHLNNLGDYYQAIKNATQATRREFAPVIEVFEQTAGPPISEGEFAAVPTNLPRLLRQIDIAESFSKHCVAFGVPEYLTPVGGESAGNLYHAFVESMQGANARRRAAP
jgi:hypothetical protein